MTDNVLDEIMQEITDLHQASVGWGASGLKYIKGRIGILIGDEEPITHLVVAELPLKDGRTPRTNALVLTKNALISVSINVATGKLEATVEATTVPTRSIGKVFTRSTTKDASGAHLIEARVAFTYADGKSDALPKESRPENIYQARIQAFGDILSATIGK